MQSIHSKSDPRVNKIDTSPVLKSPHRFWSEALKLEFRGNSQW